jgi:hypothetical protein
VLIKETHMHRAHLLVVALAAATLLISGRSSARGGPLCFDVSGITACVDRRFVPPW